MKHKCQEKNDMVVEKAATIFWSGIAKRFARTNSIGAWPSLFGSRATPITQNPLGAFANVVSLVSTQ
jgi:hypothetical protein